jgi:hypothetical protein
VRLVPDFTLESVAALVIQELRGLAVGFKLKIWTAYEA